MAHAQCQQERYVDRIFTASRTQSNTTYITSPTLVAPCTFENLTINLSYNLDVYEPTNDTLNNRPCIVYSHGGAFQIGDKRIVPVSRFCEQLAERGFVVISLDYRKCFNTVSTPSAERAVYRAVQDYKAALRWTLANALTLRIDTGLVFGGGNSSGSIMSIFSAYATDADRTQVPSTFNNPDLGCLNCSGNNHPGDFRPKALINNWGATLYTFIIEAGEAPMISFHGDQDNAVVIDYGQPFSLPTFPALHGSAPITARLDSVGIVNEFHIFEGFGHEPWLVNTDFVDTIDQRSAEFLFRLFLKPDLPMVTGSNEACVGDTLIYSIQGTPEKAYCWNVVGGRIYSIPSAQHVEIVWDSSGNHALQLRALNEWDALSDTALYQVLVKDYPNANAGPDVTICQGEITGLNASGGTDYTWQPSTSLTNPNIQNPVASPTVTTLYEVEVSNGTCSSFDSVNIVVYPLPFVSAGQDTSICPGESIALQGLASGIVEWFPPGTGNTLNPVVQPSATTTYILSTTDANNCVGTDDVTVIVHPELQLPPIQFDGTLLSAILGHNYQWFHDSVAITGADQFYFEPSLSGSYFVEVTDQFGCSYLSDAFEFSVSIIPALESAPIQILPHGNGLWEITGIQSDEISITIFNALGKLCYQEMETASRKFTLKETGKRLYIAKIQSSKGVFTQKFVNP